MPSFKAILSSEEIVQAANYVLSLSGEPHNPEAAKAGDALFHGKAGCYACHGPDAKGMTAIGSANLTDKIWLWADVQGAKTPEAKLDEVKHVLINGANNGVMPAWGARLNPEQIKLLTVYVHDSLGGGK
jgi:cytochrome c oxidase cbb3-type subunit 3